MHDHLGYRAELFVVDDDASMRDLLGTVFTHEGYRVTGFAEGESFLLAARLRKPSCILLDVHMPGRTGIDILKALDAPRYGAPIFIISAHGEIALAVEAIKNGAFDFIEKPFETNAVVTRVRQAVSGCSRVAREIDRREAGAQRFAGQERLTPRERDVLAEIAGGSSNKEVGRRFNISPRTVEVHRARIMDKLKAKNAADLVRIVLTGSSGDAQA
jgi:two-component system response regulator FixJ